MMSTILYILCIMELSIPDHSSYITQQLYVALFIDLALSELIKVGLNPFNSSDEANNNYKKSVIHVIALKTTG